MKNTPCTPANALLLTLQDVSELVSNSHDLDETLTNIVELIQARFKADVCSVYTVDDQRHDLVLSATVGLHRESVGKVRMSFDEGLTGLAATTKAPVNVADARSHPQFRHFPESGEDDYRSFLGVPLVHGGAVLGVLVLQYREHQARGTDEERLLLGVAAQLAVLVINARLTRALARVVHQNTASVRSGNEVQVLPVTPKWREMSGTPAGPGLALGNVLRFEEFDFAAPALVSRTAGTIAEEHARFADALDQGRAAMERASRRLGELLGDQFGALMQVQRVMLEDKTVQHDIFSRIDLGDSAEQAVVAVCQNYLRAFAKLDNPFFYERIYDIKDVFRRLLDHAVPARANQASGEPVIIVAHEVSLLELLSCDLDRVRGVVVEKGGAYSHVAILARSLGLPVLTQAEGILEQVVDGDEIFLDGDAGLVYINPDAARREIFARLLKRSTQDCDDDMDTPLPLRLEGTVNLLPEVVRTVRQKASGVGLYRSEFLELANRSFPTEEEQLATYRKMLQLLEGRPLTLRTLDLRAEKIYGLSAAMKRDLVWEWRLVDELPHIQDLVRTQLRAALRAGADGPIRVLFPMIVSERQFHCAMRLLHEARASLRAENLPHAPRVPVGLMIEVPAAVRMVSHWAPQVDFFCIGSNDMLHALLGIERNDDQLRRLKTPLEPAYLKTVREVVVQAHDHDRPVTVCGEAASNPTALLALLALEVDGVSVPPDDLPKARRALTRVEIPGNLALIRHRLEVALSVEEVSAILESGFQPIRHEDFAVISESVSA